MEVIHLVKVGERKERSDKKRQVKPLIPSETREQIFRISHVTQTPIKDICEYLIVYIMRDTKAIDTLSKHFKRNITIRTTLYRGDRQNPTISKRLQVESELVTTKFKRDDYDLICAIAYALDITPTRATAILLEMATYDVKIVNQYVHEYLLEELHDWQMKELRNMLSYGNQYNDDNSSWLSVLSAIVGEIRPATRKLRELVEEVFRGK